MREADYQTINFWVSNLKLDAQIQAMTEAIEVLDDDIENNYQPPRPNVTTGPVWADGYNENQFGREIDLDTGEFLDGKRCTPTFGFMGLWVFRSRVFD